MESINSCGSCLARGKETSALSCKGFPLRDVISSFERALKAYHFSAIGSSYARVHFAKSLHHWAIDIRQGLRAHLDSIDKGEINEVLGLDLKEYSKRDHWLKDNRLEIDMMAYSDKLLQEYEIIAEPDATTADLYNSIVQVVDDICGLMKEIMRKMSACKPELYENFFKLKALQSGVSVINQYERWKERQRQPLTMQALIEKQALECANYLKTGVFDFISDTPSSREIKEVRYDYLLSLLPWNFVTPEDFKETCAKFRRFISWQKNILHFDFKRYGKYVFDNYYNFRREQLETIFNLHTMLQLIHQDMMQMPENVLFSEVAMKYWQRLEEQGFVDQSYMLMPDTTRQQAMLIAESFAEKLGLKSKWKPFEDHWGIKNLAQEKYELQQTGLMPPRFRDIGAIFED